MPFIVAVHYEARPDRVEALLALIRNDFALSASQQPSRRFARLFQRRHEAWRMLAVEEWQAQVDFERHAAVPDYAEALASCGSPPRLDALERLQHYRHLPHPLTALSYATITVPLDRAGDAESF